MQAGNLYGYLKGFQCYRGEFVLNSVWLLFNFNVFSQIWGEGFFFFVMLSGLLKVYHYNDRSWTPSPTWAGSLVSLWGLQTRPNWPLEGQTHPTTQRVALPSALVWFSLEHAAHQAFTWTNPKFPWIFILCPQLVFSSPFHHLSTFYQETALRKEVWSEFSSLKSPPLGWSTG